MRLRFIVASLAAGLLAPSVIAQAPRPGIAQSVDVKMISVDVHATDGDGHAVPDLTAGDFELFEDGQPQTIASVYRVNRGVRSGSSEDSAIDRRQLRRRTLVLIDNNFLAKRDRDIAIAKLDAFVDSVHSAEPDAEWSIAMVGQRLDLLQPFTSATEDVHVALKQARSTAVTSFRAQDEDRDILSDPFRRRERGAGYDFDSAVAFEGRERTNRTGRSLGNLTAAVAQLARSYTAGSGHKLLVLITGDIEMNTAFAAYEGSNDREMRDTKTGIDKLLESVVREANASNVTVFVVNASSHDSMAPQHDVSQRSFGGRTELSISGASDTSDSDSAGMKIALGTGGQYLTSSAVAESYESIDSATASYYSIGYTPAHDDDGAFHSITVKAKRPGIRIKHRQGYVDLSPEQRLEQLLRVRISALQPARDVPVALTVGKIDKKKGEGVVTLSAVMPFRNLTLLPSGDQYVGRVYVYLSIFDHNGQNVGFHRMMQDVGVSAAELAEVLKAAFRYDINVKLARGEYTLAVTMRDDLSREIGTAVQKLKM